MDTLVLNADGSPLSHVPLSVITWQVAMRLLFLGKVRVLKEYDDWTVRSPRVEMKVPSIVMLTDHVKWSRGIKYSSTNVYLRDDFTCQLQSTTKCKEARGKVRHSELTIDHVVPKSRGGKTNWLNVCTACKTCNSEKGADATIRPKHKPYKPTYYEIMAKRKTLPVNVRDAEWGYYIGWPEELIRISPSANHIAD